MISVSLCASELLGGFQFVGALFLHAAEPPGSLQTVFFPSFLVCREIPIMASDCGVSFPDDLSARIFWDASSCGVFRASD